MDLKEKIVSIMRTRGPVIPVQISKELATNMIFASAHLSEMVSNGKVYITKNLKIGGSPLYYLPGQEYKLQDFIKNLNEKDRRTFELLKEGKILRDKEQSPLVQVSLRAIKDFAVPLQVTHADKQEIFWKFYLLSNDDARRIIESKLKGSDKAEPEKEENKPEQAAHSQVMEKEKPEKPHTRGEELKKEEPRETKETKRPEPIEKKKEETREKEPVSEIKRQIDRREEVPKELRKKDILPTEPEGSHHDEQTFIETTITDPFAKEVHSFFSKNKIVILQNTVVKKSSEVDFLIEVPSVMGYLPYYCKAKKKQKINEGDLSSAYIQGQLKKLPVMFITTGELNKKAKELIEKDFKGIVVKRF